MRQVGDEFAFGGEQLADAAGEQVERLPHGGHLRRAVRFHALREIAVAQPFGGSCELTYPAALQGRPQSVGDRDRA